MRVTRLISAAVLPFLILYQTVQSSAQVTFPLEETWWEGSYSCAQGQTGLRLKTKASPNGTVEALFEFGPLEGNSNLPTGAFLMKGSISNQSLQLSPDHWLSRPANYSMVGLVGIVSGNTYHGTVVGYRCDEFLLTRQTGEVVNNAPPRTPSVHPNTHVIVIPLQTEGGTFTVPVLINNKLTLNFVIDSGAADVSIPADVVLTLMRTNTLDETDFLGEQIYKLADGSTVPSKTFRIRSLKVGDKVLENVTGSLASARGSLLLGQSFLTRFKSWSIDNRRHVLILE